MKKTLLAEALGTFFLVFAGTGAIIASQTFGQPTHAGVAATFGLVVMVLIFGFGDLSGAHFNPAVTLGFARAGRFDWNRVLPYLLAQTVGALAASGLLRLLFPENQRLGGTFPAGSAAQSFVFEILLTAFLMLIILNVTTGAKEKGITAAIAIGATVGLEALFAGPVCGASMNPVRSLAPALVSGQLEFLWIYLTAPPLGAFAAVSLHCFFYPKNHSREGSEPSRG
ncbi:MAG: aquaporin [Sphingobacteriaceae bacterium]|nr:aquaporin [Cytophagaceae bacterium]